MLSVFLPFPGAISDLPLIIITTLGSTAVSCVPLLLMVMCGIGTWKQAPTKSIGPSTPQIGAYLFDAFAIEFP